MRQHTRGLTLIELMVVVAVIAILATIAVVSWGNFVRRSARSDAMTALSDLRIKQEQYRLAHPQYAPTLASFTPALSATSPNGKYAIAITNSGVASFTATATPTGSQATDDCGTFAINQDGPFYTGYADAQCWRR